MVDWMDLSFKLKMAEIHDNTEMGTAIAVKFENRPDEIYFAVDFQYDETDQIIVILGDEIRDASFIFHETIDRKIFTKTGCGTKLLVKFREELLPVKRMSFDESDDIILTI